MKYIFSSIILILYTLFTINYYSQTTGEEFIISTAGEDAIMSNGNQVSWTIGELVTVTAEMPEKHFTQGFHQPYINVTDVIDHQPSFMVNIFPNPATDYLFIKLETIRKGDRYQLLDVKGKLLHNEPIVNTEITLPFNSYSTGVYFLVFINNENEKLKTYKIQISH